MATGVLGQAALDDGAVGKAQRERAGDAVRGVVGHAHVACRGKAVGHDASPGRFRKLRKRWVLAADDEGPVGGNRCHERLERRADLVDAAYVVVEMVGLDIGDERDVGRKVQERSVALVGLDDVIVSHP